MDSDSMINGGMEFLSCAKLLTVLVIIHVLLALRGKHPEQLHCQESQQRQGQDGHQHVAGTVVASAKAHWHNRHKEGWHEAKAERRGAVHHSGMVVVNNSGARSGRLGVCNSPRCPLAREAAATNTTRSVSSECVAHIGCHLHKPVSIRV